MAIQRDINSMDIYTIDDATGKKSLAKAGAKITKTLTPSSTTSESTDSTFSQSSSMSVDWKNIKNVPSASENTDGILVSSLYKEIKKLKADFEAKENEPKKELKLTAGDIEETEDKKFISADLLNKLIELLEAQPKKVTSTEDLVNLIADLKDGVTLNINKAIDLSNDQIVFKDIEAEVNLKEDITTNNSGHGIVVSSGKVTLSGKGKFVTTTPYSANNGTGVIFAKDSGELVFDGSGVNAVLDNPVDNGQFGVTLVGDSPKVVVNDGDFEAGWYCISGNGAKTGKDAVIEINGGTFKSVADYAIYHPHAGTLTVNGGYIYGAAGAISMNNGTLNIHGGILTSDDTGDTGSWSDGTSGQGNACISLTAKYGPVTCNIDGGIFDTANSKLFIVGTKNKVTINISGGKFNVKPDDSWIASGFACSTEKDSNGYYTIEKVS